MNEIELPNMDLDRPISSTLSVHRLPSHEGRIAEGGVRVNGGPAKSVAITVIIVVFNGAEDIKNSVRRISALRRNDLELIIIDGGSRDGTIEFLKESDSLIDYWVSEKDRGIYDAMNKGWSLAKLNSHVIYMGVGDYMTSLPDTQVLQSDVIFYGDVLLGDYLFRSGLSSRLKLGNTLHHQALLIPKKLHPTPPFDLDFKVYADYDFNLRLYKQGCQFARSDALEGYALPGGVSAAINITEMSAVVCKNYGYVWGGMSFLYGALLALKCKLRARLRA
ncbi:Glycosyltransferase (modular protein) [Pseudomonas sp. 8AS]|uniref:glycosyltransferase n=1 Tax=Pseudomonas sp. 8AS TaxID=2653163 RepID=UPI0012F1578B|nr:glycosyltransferase [Pseudomonas sp. 8AS]VXB83639.1 Glycosyltransferase (modular protein) [Pseudomonas sp. 8AS]